MDDWKRQRVLGRADYAAQLVSKTNLVKVTATGFLPCSNFTAALEERPERTIPPMWDMVFYVAPYCERRITYFELSEYAPAAPDSTGVIVHDATGEVEVPITGLIAEPVFERAATVLMGDTEYIVVALSTRGPGHVGCRVFPADAYYPAIYTRIHGPAPLTECAAFMAETCESASAMLLAGGEIPWPLLA